MPERLKPQRVEEPAIRPELVELRENPTLRNPADALSRVNGLVTELTAHEFDVFKAAMKFGLDLRGLDVPKKVGLTPLYLQVNSANYEGAVVHTFCLGMLSVDGDISVRGPDRLWVYANHPEDKPFGGNRVPSYVCPAATFTDEPQVTCFAKYHVILRENNGLLLINPIQFSRPSYLPGVVEAFQQLRERFQGDKNELRSINHRAKLALEQAGINIPSQTDVDRAMSTVFKHADRNLVMGLIGLEAARSLGIRDVALPSVKLLVWKDTMTDAAKRKIWESKQEPPFIQRYRQVRDFP